MRRAWCLCGIARPPYTRRCAWTGIGWRRVAVVQGGRAVVVATVVPSADDDDAASVAVGGVAVSVVATRRRHRRRRVKRVRRLVGVGHPGVSRGRRFWGAEKIRTDGGCCVLSGFQTFSRHVGARLAGSSADQSPVTSVATTTTASSFLIRHIIL